MSIVTEIMIKLIVILIIKIVIPCQDVSCYRNCHTLPRCLMLGVNWRTLSVTFPSTELLSWLPSDNDHHEEDVISMIMGLMINIYDENRILIIY